MVAMLLCVGAGMVSKIAPTVERFMFHMKQQWHLSWPFVALACALQYRYLNNMEIAEKVHMHVDASCGWMVLKRCYNSCDSWDLSIYAVEESLRPSAHFWA
jgi:hypothetical protein